MEIDEAAKLPLDTWNRGGMEMILEIGFGMGEASVEIAESRPNCLFLAAEVHKPGIGRLLNEIDRREIKNIRVLSGDADILVNSMLEAESLAGVHVFFPDPWPKKRHHKRRLLQESFFHDLLRVLKPGGYIYAVTDWEDYAEWILREAESTEGLHNPHGGYAPPVSWRPRTRFEKKGLDKAHLIREIWLEKSSGTY